MTNLMIVMIKILTNLLTANLKKIGRFLALGQECSNTVLFVMVAVGCPEK